MHLQGPEDLYHSYHDVFRTANRNAASHLWVSYIANNSAAMTMDELHATVPGFCAVSGSPIFGGSNTKYRVRLRSVAGGSTEGVVYHCCWPCICDTVEMMWTDTMTMRTQEGEAKYHVLVIGDPCKYPEKIHQRYEDSFSGRWRSLADAAPELDCVRIDGRLRLKGAKFSDHGYPVIGFLDTREASIEDAAIRGAGSFLRNRRSRDGLIDTGNTRDATFGFDKWCTGRKSRGYDSGMGKIFHLVAGINPIVDPAGKISN